MKLFNVIGETVSEGSICELYIAKSKEEAMDRFEEEFNWNFFHYINVVEIDKVDGYKIYLQKEIKNAKQLTEDKKEILKNHMGSVSSQIDFNKVRDEWRKINERS